MAPAAIAQTLRPPRADGVLALALAAVGLVEIWVAAPERPVLGPVVVLAMVLPLAWRRSVPLASAAAVMLAMVAAVLLVVPVDDLTFFILVLAIALYSLGAYATACRAVLGLVLAAAVNVAAVTAKDGPGLENLLFGLVVAGGPWLAGRLVRHRTDSAVALALQAVELERTQADREEKAVRAERARIARELHDIISHSVSVMTIQAGAIEAVLDQDPDKARSAAASIRQTGRQAQGELRRLLGVLREEGGVSARTAPQPGLADLEELVAGVRSAGLQVRLAYDEPPRPLPAAVELWAFRVVQEALTNTLKHANASTASVSVRCRRDALEVEVTDDGETLVPAGEAPGEGSGKGHGLVGMRERVALYGGTLEYASHPTGFRIRAVLPVGNNGSPVPSLADHPDLPGRSA